MRTAEINMSWRKEKIHVLSRIISFWDKKICFPPLSHGNNCLSLLFSLILVSDILVSRESWLGAWPMGLQYLICRLWSQVSLSWNAIERSLCTSRPFLDVRSCHIWAHIQVFFPLKSRHYKKMAGLCSRGTNVTSVQCYYMVHTWFILTIKRTHLGEGLNLMPWGPRHSPFHFVYVNCHAGKQID